MAVTAEAGQAAGVPLWMQVEEVCRAAVGIGAGRKAVAALAMVLRQAEEAGAPDGLAERLAALVMPPKAQDGAETSWLTLMCRSGKITEAELRAAREIVHVLHLRSEACTAAIPAVDPSRIVVDGGPPPGARVYRLSLEPAVGRYERWVDGVRELEPRQRVVRGRNAALSVLAIVEQVLVAGVGPNTLDKRLGVRNGRCGDVVARELKRYAKYHFRA